MPLWVPVLSYLALSLVALATLAWLLLNARAVALVFRRVEGVDPGPPMGRPRRPASRSKVLAMLVLFNLCWVASLAIYWASSDDDVQAAVEANA